MRVFEPPQNMLCCVSLQDEHAKRSTPLVIPSPSDENPVINVPGLAHLSKRGFANLWFKRGPTQQHQVPKRRRIEAERSSIPE